jgi:hypothetical protein
VSGSSRDERIVPKTGRPAPRPHAGADGDGDIRVTIRQITEGRGNGNGLTSTCRTTPVSDEFDDLKAMKRDGYSVRHVTPFNAQPWKVDEFWEAERREADRERKKRARKRSKEARMPTLTKRAKIVHDILSDGWISVSSRAGVRPERSSGDARRRLADHQLH